MLIVDRVLCDCCGQLIGQLYNQPPSRPDQLPDLNQAPYQTLCPDCMDKRESGQTPSTTTPPCSMSTPESADDLQLAAIIRARAGGPVVSVNIDDLIAQAADNSHPAQKG